MYVCNNCGNLIKEYVVLCPHCGNNTDFYEEGNN